MRDNITAALYGPQAQGPELIRAGDNHWGKYLEEAFAGKDNEDIIEKTRIIGKHTFYFGTVFAILDVTMYNRTGGWVNVLQRLKWHYTPWLGCTVAYTTAVCCISSARGGKTDQWNHFAAGFAAGSVLGKKTKSFLTGMLSGFVIGTIGWWYKDSKMNGYELIPSIWKLNRVHGHPFTHKSDMTTNLFPERPGYWARSQADVEKVYNRGQLSDGNSYHRIW